MISIPISLASLALAGTKAYYLQRMPDFADPDPNFKSTVLPLLPLYVFMTCSFVLNWTIILAYVKAFTLAIILLVIVINIGVIVALTLVLRSRSKDFVGLTELNMKAALTTLFVPCVVGHHKAHLLILSQVSTTVCLLTSLCLVPTLTDIAGAGVEQNPPIFYCFQTPNETLAGNVCLISNGTITECEQSMLRICSRECHDSIRFCVANEGSFDVFWHVLSPILLSLCTISLCLGIFLQWMSNYANFYHFTKGLGGKGHIHRSLIFTLIQSADIDTLQTILRDANDESVKVMINRQNRKGQTPLHVAVSNRQFDIMKLLLESGADSSIRDASRILPLEVTSGFGMTPLQIFVADKDVEMAEVLLKGGANTDVYRQHSGNTLLHKSIYNEDAAMVRLLLNYVRYQIGEAKNGDGDTALHLAVSSNNHELVKILLGAKWKNTLSQIRMPARRSSSKRKMSVDDFEIEDDYLGANYFEEIRLDVNARDRSGYTPLHLATIRENSEMVELLMNNAAKADVQNKLGDTPLHLAVIQRQIDLTEVILKNMDGGSADVPNKDGNTPLHLAASNGDQKLTNLLLEYRAGADLKNKCGETPLDVAMARGNADVAESIMKSGVAGSKVPSGPRLDYRPVGKSAEMYNKLVENYEVINGESVMTVIT